MNTAKARSSFRALVRRVQHAQERVRLTRYGKTVAGIVPVRDLDLLEACEEDGPQNRRARSASRDRQP